MADNTSIEWTDATWNPVRGCSRISPGCGGANHQGGCYAEKIAARFSAPGMPFHGFAERTEHGGRWTGKMALVDEQLGQPLRWKKPRRIFVNSMSDLFHKDLPDEAIDKVFAVMALCPQHTFQVLTKRADRMRDYIRRAAPRVLKLDLPASHYTSVSDVYIDDRLAWPLPNVWLGVSVEDQERADERIPHLLATPAAKRFLSCEPLLGKVDLRNHRVCDSCGETPYKLFSNDPHCPKPMPVHDSWQCPLHWWPSDGCDGALKSKIDWVIVGGESGPRSRPMHPDWARSLRDQCQAAGVPFFFKQWGEYGPGWFNFERNQHVFKQFKSFEQWVDKASAWVVRGSLCLDSAGHELRNGGDFMKARDSDRFPVTVVNRIGKAAAGAFLDGCEWREFPTPA